MLALLSGAAAMLPAKQESASASSAEPAGNKPRFVPGQVLVRFRSEAVPKKSLTLLSGAGRQIPVLLERFGGSEIVNGLFLAHVPEAETLSSVDSLQERSDVLYAEPNYIWQRAALPNDPRLNEQWGLADLGQAWGLTTGSNSVVVGVLDSGIDINHPDLQANIWTNPGEVAGNGVDDDGNGFIDDVHGWDFHHNDNTVFDNETGDDHGTHVAGTIGARGDNSIGVTGVCWQVTLMPIKGLGPTGGSVADIIAGYNYAKLMRDRGVNLRVLNNSYGGRGHSQAAQDAIAQLDQAGILFVVAAGNDQHDNNHFPVYPANYEVPNVIAVAATAQGFGIDSFYSNYGKPRVALAAPGTGILSTTPNNSYSYYSGTSMASAYVSGAAALLAAARPDITVRALRGALVYSNAQPQSLQAEGFLNVYTALLAALENDTTPPAAPANLVFHPPFPNGRNVELSWTAPGDDGGTGPVADYDLTFVTQQGARIPIITRTNPGPPGSSQNLINLPVPFGHATGTFELRAYDNAGNSSASSVGASVNVNEGVDPYIPGLSPNAPLSTGGQRLTLDGDDRYFTYSLPFNVGPGGNFNYATVSTNGAIHFGLNPPRAPGGFPDDIPSSIEFLTGQATLAVLWADLEVDQSRRADAGVFVQQPNNDTVIFRWQATVFGSNNPVNFEAELRRDGTFVCRYGPGNQDLSPVVGLSFGQPAAYVISSHTVEYWQAGPRLNLGQAQTVTFATRVPPPVVVFDFENETYQDTESAGSVTVKIKRPTSTSFGFPILGAYSVSYATSAGTATPGSDYTETSGTLTFGVGEGLKAFTVPINNDATIEPNETFNVTLSNPTNGSGLGFRSSVGVTVFDDDAAPTKQVDFSSSTYQVDEGGGAALITLTRSGDLSGAIAVDYLTSDGTAQQRSDYVLASGTLQFAAGEATESFSVLVSDDLYFEANEVVNLLLNNPSGASLGSRNVASLVIQDNDLALATTNPLDEAQFFVRQHYYDFLSRVPDAGGFTFWTGQITQCGTDQACIRTKRNDVSNAFYYELEYQQTGSYVYRLYRIAFGNDQPFPNPNAEAQHPNEEKKLPSYAVFARDRARVRGGASLAQLQLDLANSFVQRNEFVARYLAGLSGPDFVDALLARIQNDSSVNLASERQALITLFNSGGRGAVLYRLADDNAPTNPINNRALIDAEYNRAFVATQYFGYLRRDADISGFIFWLGQVNGAPLRDVARQHAMVCSFITSAEYQQRFSPVVTRANSDCQQ